VGFTSKLRFDCKAHGDRSSTGIHGGEAAVNVANHRQPKAAERGTSGAAFGCPSAFVLLCAGHGTCS